MPICDDDVILCHDMILSTSDYPCEPGKEAYLPPDDFEASPCVLRAHLLVDVSKPLCRRKRAILSVNAFFPFVLKRFSIPTYL